MKSSIAILLIVLTLSAFVQADSDPNRFSHAELIYLKGNYDAMPAVSYLYKSNVHRN